HGFSDQRAGGMTASLPAAERLKAVPPADWTWQASSGACVRYSNPTQAHGTSSTVRDCLYPGERLPTEPANRSRWARCTLSTRPSSHQQATPATPADDWRTPWHARLPTGAQAPRRAADFLLS